VNGPLGDIAAYLGDPASWSGDGGLVARTGEHLWVSLLALLVAVLVAVPLSLWLGHVGRGGVLAINAGNAARAVPSYAVLVIFVLLPDPLGANTFSFVLALALFSLPPLLTNTYVGVREVDRDVVDAARGVGMSGWQVLARVELPLALPLVMTGLRLAAVQVVATTTVIGLVGGGGLGRLINSGFANSDQGQVMGAALVVTALALVTEGVLALAERSVRRRRASTAGPRSGGAAVPGPELVTASGPA
jgi:osmoprotectant transport system permease protein